MNYRVSGSEGRAIDVGQIKLLTMVFAALVAVALVAASFATRADAHVEGVTGTATVKLSTSKGAGKKLKKNKVSFSPKTVALDVRARDTSGSDDALIVKTANIKFTAKTKKPNKKVKKTNVKVSIVAVTVASDRAWFDIKVGNKTIKKALSAPAISLTMGATSYTYELASSSLKLENAGAKAIAKGLKIKNNLVKSGVLGTAAFEITFESEYTPDENPYQDVCPIDATGQLAGSLGTAPAPAVYPEFDIAQALADLEAEADQTLSWGWRSSFLNYVFFSGGSFHGSGGAEVVQPSPAAAPTNFNFPVAEGTYEAGSDAKNSNGKLVAESEGRVILCNAPHGFAIAFENPTVVLDDENSRLTITISSYVDGTWSESRTVDFADLNPSASEGVYSESGHKVTFSSIPATLTADGAAVMSSLGSAFVAYEEGYQLAPVTVSGEIVGRPFAGTCDPPSFGANPVAVNAIDFTRAAFPTLTEPTSGTGSSFNWGFRRSLRASVSGGGATNPLGPNPLFGGVTASHPGNMGGTAANPLPAGGIGKYFTFPSSYEWEAGAQPTDVGRLVVRSEGTLAFCNITQGAYNIILSKPTIIIDGANSRIVVNAYAARHAGGQFNWQGGLVDLVKLDVSNATVAEVEGVRTISNIRVLVDGDPAVGLRTDALILGTLTPASTGTSPAAPEEPNGWDPISISIPLPA